VAGRRWPSLFILGWLALGRGNTASPSHRPCCVWVWIASTVNLNSHYLEIFRVALRNGTLKDTVHLPALDMGALEVLFSALNSPDDADVLGALDVLDQEGRAQLVPALNPLSPLPRRRLSSPQYPGESGRVDFVPIADRLIDSPDADIRAAAVRAARRCGLRRRCCSAPPRIRARSFARRAS